MIKNLVEHIVKNLVDNPQAVSVEVASENNKLFVKIRVASDDFGRVIGKEGRTFKAIQALAVSVEPKLTERTITIDAAS